MEGHDKAMRELVEISPPDIEPYRNGNTGIEYVTSFRAGKPGPHVLVSALVHGNELCGALALDYFFRQGIRPARGELTLAFVNVAAMRRFDPAKPGLSRYVDEDFNRLWSTEVLASVSRQSVELRRARQLRQVVDRADLLLDLHSMQTRCPPLILSGRLEKGLDLARSLGSPQHIVRDRGHDAGKRMRDYDGFDDPASPRAALLVECGPHWQRDTVDVAIDTMFRFLTAAGTIEAATAEPHLRLIPPPSQTVIEVSGPYTVKSKNFRFSTDYAGLEAIEKAGTVIGYDGKDPVTTPFDDCVLIMPSRNLKPGMTAVRFGRIAG